MKENNYTKALQNSIRAYAFHTTPLFGKLSSISLHSVLQGGFEWEYPQLSDLGEGRAHRSLSVTAALCIPSMSGGSFEYYCWTDTKILFWIQSEFFGGILRGNLQNCVCIAKPLFLHLVVSQCCEQILCSANVLNGMKLWLAEKALLKQIVPMSRRVQINTFSLIENLPTSILAMVRITFFNKWNKLNLSLFLKVLKRNVVIL